MKFNKHVSYIIFFLFQLCFTLSANANIDLETNEVFKLIEIQNDSVETKDSVIAVFEIRNTTNHKWLIRTSCWREVEIQITQGDSLVNQDVFSWNNQSSALICHELSAKRSLLFPLTLPQGNMTLKIIAKNPLEANIPKSFNISIGTQTYFTENNQETLFSVVIITIPILLTFGLFNLIFFFVLRDRSYLMYCFVQISFVFIYLVAHGYIPLPFSMVFHLLTSAKLLFIAAYTFFTVVFFNTFKTEPWLHRILLIYVFFTLFLFLLSIALLGYTETVVYNWIIFYTIYLSIGITAILLLSLIVKRVLKKDKLAYSFGAVMLLFCLFAIGSALLQTNVVSELKGHHNGVSLVMIIESISFTIILAYRFKYLKNQLHKSIIEVQSTVIDNNLIKSELHHSINENFDFEQDWAQVQIKFELLHRGFIERLEKEYSNLSLTDVKMCILMKMNLSPKEIASFLNIQPRSITQANYRMKKKMKLSSDVVIGNHIRSL